MHHGIDDKRFHLFWLYSPGGPHSFAGVGVYSVQNTRYGVVADRTRMSNHMGDLVAVHRVNTRRTSVAY